MATGTDFSQSLGSEIVFDFFCEICNDFDKHVEAEGYCVDCGEYLCGPCYNAHGRTRATRCHVLKDKDHMPTDTPLSTDRVCMYINTKCKFHSAKIIKYYCKSHDVLGCSTCFVEKHRGCSDIESIADVSVNILDNQEFKDFIDKLQSMQRKSRDIFACARENKTISKRCYADTISAVRQLKEEAIARLNEVEQNILTLAEQIKTEDENKMKNVEEDGSAFYEQLQQMSSELEGLQMSKRVSQLYVSMRTLDGDLEALQNNLLTLEKENVVRTFRFEPNAELMSFLRSTEVLGEVSQQTHKARAINIALVPRNETTSNVTSDSAERILVHKNQIQKTKKTSTKTASTVAHSFACCKHKREIRNRFTLFWLHYNRFGRCFFRQTAHCR